MKRQLYAIALTLGIAGCVSDQDANIPQIRELVAEQRLVTEEQRKKYGSCFEVYYQDIVNVNVIPESEKLSELGLSVIEPKQDSLATLVENFTIDYSDSARNTTFRKELEKLVKDSYILGLLETIQRKPRGANAYSVKFKIKIETSGSSLVHYSATIAIYQQ